MGIYDGIKALEIAGDIGGSVAGLACATRGAQVIKLETPAAHSLRYCESYSCDESKLFQALNRGKLSVVLSENDSGPVLDRLVADQDILIVSDTACKNPFDMSYERARKIRPDIIYIALTAFGSAGPMKDAYGNDLVIQAFSGAMMAERKTRADDITPARIKSTRLADYGSGLAMAIGISAALLHRQRTGQGQLVETSLLHNMLMLQGGRCIQNDAADAATRPARDALLAARKSGKSLRETVATPAVVINPFYRAYQTLDGAVFVGALTRGLRDKARAALKTDLLLRDSPNWDPKDPIQTEEAQAKQAEIEAGVKRETTAYWIDVLERAGVPTGEVVFPEDLAATPHIKENSYLMEIRHETAGEVLQVAPPIRYGLFPLYDRCASPTYGRDTDKVLKGYL